MTMIIPSLPLSIIGIKLDSNGLRWPHACLGPIWNRTGRPFGIWWPKLAQDLVWGHCIRICSSLNNAFTSLGDEHMAAFASFRSKESCVCNIEDYRTGRCSCDSRWINPICFYITNVVEKGDLLTAAGHDFYSTERGRSHNRAFRDVTCYVSLTCSQGCDRLVLNTCMGITTVLSRC
jgi:hypothetical protein